MYVRVVCGARGRKRKGRTGKKKKLISEKCLIVEGGSPSGKCIWCSPVRSGPISKDLVE